MPATPAIPGSCHSRALVRTFYRHEHPNGLPAPMTLLGRLRQHLTTQRIRRWARRRLRAGDAVVLDTETTDLFGHVVQLSVIDTDGTVLLDTLVCPPVPITAAATAVHGLRDVDVADAPTARVVAPQLLEVTRGRRLLAYNAPYDRAVLAAELTAAGVNPGSLADVRRWSCLMRLRSRAEGAPWARLQGTHDALGDCRATLAVLRDLAGARP